MKTKFTFLFAIAMLVAVGMNAQTVLLEENFTTADESTLLPVGWTALDEDADGNGWYHLGDNAPTILGNDGQPGVMTSASYVGGGGEGYAVNPDNWLITPEVSGAQKITFFVNAQDAAWPSEHYAVLASSAGPDAGDFTVVFEETLSAKAQGAWHEKVVDLPAGTRYVAFRHYDCTDFFRINLDGVKVEGQSSSITNLQQQGIRVIGGKGMLTISANDAAAAQIFNVTGQLVNTVSLSKTETTIQLSAGVYLVRVGKNVAKVLVK